MRDVIDAMPIVRALRAIQGDRLAIALLAALAFYGGLALATPWSSSLQRRVMRLHHFKPVSLVEWLALQPLPKMYGMSHEVWLGGAPPSDRVFTATAFRANHYPARFLRFDGRRDVFHAERRWPYARLRTRYGDTTFVSSWRLYAGDAGLVFEPLEAPP